MDTTITIEGLDEVEAGFVRVNRGVVYLCERTVNRVAKAGIAVAHQVKTYHDRTGTLSKETKANKVFANSDGAEAEMVAATPYASLVEGGTKPHEIRAKGGGSLAFPGSDGETVFRKVVHHPGTKPRPFMGPAYQKAERMLPAEMETATEEACELFDR